MELLLYNTHCAGCTKIVTDEQKRYPCWCEAYSLGRGDGYQTHYCIKDIDSQTVKCSLKKKKKKALAAEREKEDQI